MFRQVVDQELLDPIPGHTVWRFEFLANLAIVAQGFNGALFDRRHDIDRPAFDCFWKQLIFGFGNARAGCRLANAGEDAMQCLGIGMTGGAVVGRIAHRVQLLERQDTNADRIRLAAN